MPSIDATRRAVLGTAPTPEETPKQAPEAPAAPVAIGPGTYRVSLKDNPARVIDAIDRLDAIEKYKVQCGIVDTIHKFTVESVA